MDVFTENMLISLKFGDLIEEFTEQLIDREVLLSLSDLELKELVPNLGKRKKIANYLKNYSTETLNTPDVSEINIVGNTNADIISVIESETASCSTSLVCPDNVNYNSCSSQEPLHEVGIEPPPKKSKLGITFFEGDLSLEEFLKRSLIGRGILEHFQKNKYLKDNVRSDLVWYVIDGILVRHNTMSSSMAESLAAEIIGLFPTECKNTYYYPAIAKSKNSGGKLLDRYRNIKRKYSKSKTTNTTNVSDTTICVDEEILYKIEWLKTSSHPWHQVEQYWTDTCKARMKDRGDSGVIADFINKWPSLKNELGYTLVSIFYHNLLEVTASTNIFLCDLPVS